MTYKRDISEYDNFEIITDYNNLYAAHKKCRKGKLWKDSVASYDLRAPECTLYLQSLLARGQYKISDYHRFTVNERGKTRQIKSTQYKDRVVQKILNDNIIVPAIQPTFCYENSASQAEKGTNFALDLLRRHLREEVSKHGIGGYILICDFSGYFDSIRHDVVNDMYRSYFHDAKLVKLITDIHASIPGGIGVPLGNQLSQNDALMIASPMDHYIKERLHIRGYGRYMDDFYLIHHDKTYLQECLDNIRRITKELGLTLNSKKTKISPMKAGIDFLGFHFYVTDSGKVISRIKAKSKSRWREKIRKHKKKVLSGEMTYEQAKESFDSRKAHAKRGESYYLIRDMQFYFYTVFMDYLSEIEKAEYRKLKKEQKYRNHKRRKRKNGKNLEQSASRDAC
ncbi:MULTISPECIES: reverse transcriptase domain-containing protein [unclassified Blautia]|uniref:reverse transcriptase domain-containing protein n=1 Tax=unclassified Blautia TaxID=2648079 RepID=UPI003F8C3553